jgi:hypothetical protein
LLDYFSKLILFNSNEIIGLQIIFKSNLTDIHK